VNSPAKENCDKKIYMFRDLDAKIGRLWQALGYPGFGIQGNETDVPFREKNYSDINFVSLFP